MKIFLPYLVALIAAAAAPPTAAQHAHPQHAGHGAKHGAKHGAQHGAQPAAPSLPQEAGQSAFAAIAEIVALLEADPETDWAAVDISALRRHLVDMHLVTLAARAEQEEIDGGARFTITGEGEAAAAIQRMTLAHAPFLEAEADWRVTARRIEGGAILEATSGDPQLEAKIKALGYFGLMALGAHHQQHHLAMAQGRGLHHHR